MSVAGDLQTRVLSHHEQSCLSPAMSPPNKKIGGEYGDVRANIDAGKLNAYVEAHVPAVAAPVSIKQFKVRLPPLSLRPQLMLTYVVYSSDRFVSARAVAKARSYVLRQPRCSLTPHTS